MGGYVCEICQDTFTRQEHLERHTMSHLNKRPFKCQTCMKSFSRRDLLTRHERNHLDPSRPDTLASRRPIPPRSLAACKNCAASKQKCSGKQTCDRCLRKGIECKFSVGNTSRGSRVHKSYNQGIKRGVGADEEMTEGEGGLEPQNPLQPDASLSPPQMADTSAEPSTFFPTSNVDPALGGTGNMFTPDESPPVHNFYHGMSAADLDVFLLNIFDRESHPLQMDSFGDSNFSPMVFNAASHFETSAHCPDSVQPGLDLNSEQMEPKESQQAPPKQVLGESFLGEGKIPEHPRPPAPPVHDTCQPSSTEETLDAHSAAFEASSIVWRNPTSSDTNADMIYVRAQPNSQLPRTHIRLPIRSRRSAGDAMLELPSLAITSETRDKIVIMFTKAHSREQWGDQDLASLPDKEFLEDALECYFKYFHPQYPLLHRGTFNPNTALILLTAVMVAVGAIWSSGLTGDEEKRRVSAEEARSVKAIGYAILECVRRSLGQWYESDNSRIRDYEGHQASLITYIGQSWAGAKRKMELAEAFAGTLMAMIRRAEAFRFCAYRSLEDILNERTGSVTSTWTKWSINEQRKRLVYCTQIWDSQISALLHIPHFIAFSELSLPLPQSDTLWNAPTAEAWFSLANQELRYNSASLNLRFDQSFCTFAGRFMHDCSRGVLSHNWISSSQLLKGALLAVVHSLVFEQRQMQDLYEFRESDVSPVLTSPRATVKAIFPSVEARKLELQRILQNCDGVLHAELGPISEHRDNNISAIFVHYNALALFCSLQGILRLAGREDASSAKTALPMLQRWADQEDARLAVWHCGQIFTLARKCIAEKRVVNYLPLVLFHTGLVLWTYGILQAVMRIHRQNSGSSTPAPAPAQLLDVLVHVDQPWSDAMANFLQGKQGIPVLTIAGGFISLEKPKEVMALCRDIIKDADAGGSLAGDLMRLVSALGASGWNLIENLGASPGAF
ncbi:unnamed protein product [Tuber aestivum]|uniref:pH-response transcription factor pacC/RIM101 n=1 Tax=Tuber aestivum TaxID=59557 RepID=A0A292QA30_9PEZI|nr:unnamed protein product [Tuber aestivum]